MRIDRILRDFGCVLLGMRFYREKDARDRVECLRCVIQKQAFRGAMACFYGGMCEYQEHGFLHRFQTENRFRCHQS